MDGMDALSNPADAAQSDQTQAPAQSQPAAQAQPAAPAQPQVATSPHAGLAQYIKTLALGVDSFATSAATQGREGGVQEVQAVQQRDAEMKLKQQASQQQAQEHDLRMKTGVADYNMKQAQMASFINDMPLNHQMLSNQVQAETLKLLEAKGVPLGKAVSMAEGQGQDAHVAAINTAANGDLTANYAIPVYGPDGPKGAGGKTQVVPSNSVMGITLNSGDVGASVAAMQRNVDQATQMLGAADPSVKKASAQLDMVNKGLANGGTIGMPDWLQLSQTMNTELHAAMENKKDLTKFQTEQADLQAKQRPKDINDATGRLTTAQQAFSQSPTPLNKLGVDAAKTAVSTFQRTEAQTAAAKAYATKSAELKAMDTEDAKNAPALTDAALNYQIDPDKVFGLRGQQRANFISAMLQKDPTWSMANYKAKFDTQQDFSPKGNSGKQIESLNTFAGHAADANSLIQTLRNTNSSALNAPVNALAKQFGNDKIGPYQAALEAAKDEYLNFIKAGHAPTKEEIERGETLVNQNTSPAAAQAIMKQMANTVLIRAGSLNHQYKSTMGKDYPDMFSQEGAQAMQDLGHPEVAKFGVSGGMPAATKKYDFSNPNNFPKAQ